MGSVVRPKPPSTVAVTMRAATTRVAGGVTAYNTGSQLRESVRSLLSQELPAHHAWSEIHVVISGCTDDTPAVARQLAREDARVRVIEQPRREGKSSALREIFSRARGDRLVLLNGDARAEPGSVGQLLRAAEGTPAPFGAMARPCVPSERRGGLGDGVALMWELHHRVHAATLGTPGGNHLSDELWLLSLPVPATLPLGVVNDGAYVGAWIQGHGGRLIYAPRARVAIDVPRSASAHLRQRRRILWGHRQVREMLGTAPTTWTSYARLDPGGATRALLSTWRKRPSAVPWTVFLAMIELEAVGLSKWDRYVSGRDHVIWETMASQRRALPPPRTVPPASTDPTVSGRPPSLDTG